MGEVPPDNHNIAEALHATAAEFASAAIKAEGGTLSKQAVTELMITLQGTLGAILPEESLPDEILERAKAPSPIHRIEALAHEPTERIASSALNRNYVKSILHEGSNLFSNASTDISFMFEFPPHQKDLPEKVSDRGYPTLIDYLSENNVATDRPDVRAVELDANKILSSFLSDDPTLAELHIIMTQFLIPDFLTVNENGEYTESDPGKPIGIPLLAEGAFVNESVSTSTIHIENEYIRKHFKGWLRQLFTEYIIKKRLLHQGDVRGEKWIHPKLRRSIHRPIPRKKRLLGSQIGIDIKQGISFTDALRIEMATSYMQNNLKAAPTPEDIAVFSNLPSTLQRIKHFGVSQTLILATSGGGKTLTTERLLAAIHELTDPQEKRATAISPIEDTKITDKIRVPPILAIKADTPKHMLEAYTHIPALPDHLATIAIIELPALANLSSSGSQAIKHILKHCPGAFEGASPEALVFSSTILSFIASDEKTRAIIPINDTEITHIVKAAETIHSLTDDNLPDLPEKHQMLSYGEKKKVINTLTTLYANLPTSIRNALFLSSISGIPIMTYSPHGVTNLSRHPKNESSQRQQSYNFCLLNNCELISSEKDSDKIFSFPTLPDGNNSYNTLNKLAHHLLRVFANTEMHGVNIGILVRSLAEVVYQATLEAQES